MSQSLQLMACVRSGPAADSIHVRWGRLRCVDSAHARGVSFAGLPPGMVAGRVESSDGSLVTIVDSMSAQPYVLIQPNLTEIELTCAVGSSSGTRWTM
jgi:hypothetical protein